MTEKEAFENLQKEVAQLAATVKEHAGDRATIDEAKLAKMVQTLVDQQVAATLAEAERSRPRRKGEKIGPVGFEATSLGIVEGGKFDGKQVEDVLFANWMLGKASRLGAKVRAPSADMQAVVDKALTATGAGAGDEYVPTQLAAQLWDDFFTASRVVPTIGTVAMPTDPFDFPLGWGTMTWRKGTPNTGTTATDPTTAKVTATSTEQVAEVDWSYDLDEDSIIAVQPTLRQMITRDGAEQIDAFVMNADATATSTGNINSDDGTPAADSYYLTNGQDGLRHLFLVDNTGQGASGATLTDTLMRSLIAKLGKYATDIGRLVLFVDPVTYVSSMLGLTNVVTMDKFGPQATVLTGELSKYSGIPVVVTNSIPLTEADGKCSVTAASNTKGSIVAVHTDMWKVGFRRQLMIELDRDVQKRQLIMVVSFREAVVARGTRSTAKHTAGLYNI